MMPRGNIYRWTAILLFMILTTGFLAVSKKNAQAQLIGSNVPVAESGDVAKKEVGASLFGIRLPVGLPTSWDALAWLAAKTAANIMTRDLVNWSRRGFDGKPLFATDPQGYLTNIGDSIAGDFIKSAGFGALCSPFRIQVQTAIVNSYNASRITSRDYQAQCTLTGVVNNVQGFISGDFSQGGWQGWYQLTQVSQNNPYGAVLDAQAQLAVRLEGEKNIELTKLNWASGFLSWSDCTEHSDVNDPSKCTKRGPTKTPGSVIEGRLNEALGSPQRQLEVADELDEVIANLLKTVLGGLLDKIFGGDGIFDGTTTNVGGTGVSIPGFPNTLTIYLFPPDPVNLAEGEPYQEPGYMALDPVDGDVTRLVNVTPTTVNTTTRGTYIVTYTVTNSQGQSDTKTRTVVVGFAPIIGTCEAFNESGVSPIGGGAYDPYKRMVWKITSISGGSGNYERYYWDGSNPVVKTGIGGVSLPVDFTFFPQFISGQAGQQFPRWYDLTGPQNANVTVFDTDHTLLPGTIDCGTVYILPAP